MGGETREEGRELEREGKGDRRENGRRDKGEGGRYEDYHRDDL